MIKASLKHWGMLLRKIRFFIHIVICGLIWHGFVFFQPAAYSEDSLGDTIDCTDVNVYYVDDPNLTHEERLRLMDKAFWESVNKFEMCQSAKEMAKAAAAMDGDGEMRSSGALLERQAAPRPINLPQAQQCREPRLRKIFRLLKVRNR